LRKNNTDTGKTPKKIEHPSGCGFLDRALQRQTHHVVKIGSGEAAAAELQLSEEAPEEDAALLYR